MIRSILLTCCLVLHRYTVECLMCNSCLLSEPNCLSANVNTRRLLCSNDQQVCWTETRFIRANTSIDFTAEPAQLERKCQKPATNMCAINHHKYGPCIPNKGETELACYKCCTTDYCNSDVVYFSGGNRWVGSLVTLLVTSLVGSAWCVL